MRRTICTLILSSVMFTMAASACDSATAPVAPPAGRCTGDECDLDDPVRAVCGDGIEHFTEECDAGQHNSDAPGAICSTHCQTIDLRVLDSRPPIGVVSERYTHTLSARGGDEPLIWRIAPESGPFIDGLTIDPATGSISGFPREARFGDETRFIVEVEDALGVRVRSDLRIEVRPGYAQTLSCDGGRPAQVVRDNFILFGNCVFERDPITDTWIEVATIDPPNSELYRTSAVATEDLLIVNATVGLGTGSPSGSIEVHRRDARGAWTRSQKIEPPLRDPFFGERLALDGDTLFALGQEHAAYVLTSTTPGSWAVTSMLDEPDAILPLSAVAGAGDVLILGDLRGSRVFVYERIGSEWRRSQTISHEEHEGFGSEVATDGTTLFILCPSETFIGVAQNEEGLVYSYRRGTGGTWVEADRLQGGGGVDHLSIHGDLLVIGGPYYYSLSQGALVIHARLADQTWERSVLQSPTLAPYQFFGAEVAVDPSTWLASIADEDGGRTAYLFRAIDRR